MPTPHAVAVSLSGEQRQALRRLAGARSTPQALARRARIVLRAAAADDDDDDEPTNLQIARELGCKNDTVSLWRRRFAEHGLEGLLDRPRSGRPPVFPPPQQRLHVLELATTEDPDDEGCPSGSWSLSDLALAILQEANRQEVLMARLAAAHQAAVEAMRTGEEELAVMAALLGPIDVLPMSRSTIRRVLDEAELKPHKSAYWLNSHDKDFHAKAQEICQLYLDAPRLFEQGEVVVCTGEKAGILIRRRKHPTRPIEPGLPRRREHEHVRHGSAHLSVSFCVPTGQVAYDLTQTHGGDDFAAHLLHAALEMPQAGRYHWVLDNNRTHSTPAVCAAVARLCGVGFDVEDHPTAGARREWLADPSHGHVFHFAPVHGSWLNQAELFFSVISRKLLKRDDFASRQEFVQRVGRWMRHYNEGLAHPYRWTHAGTPLARETPFERTRRQQKRGRAPFGSRPKCFERVFFPPRPYHKASA